MKSLWDNQLKRYKNSLDNMSNVTTRVVMSKFHWRNTNEMPKGAFTLHSGGATITVSSTLDKIIAFTLCVATGGDAKVMEKCLIFSASSCGIAWSVHLGLLQPGATRYWQRTVWRAINSIAAKSLLAGSIKFHWVSSMFISVSSITTGI